MAVVEEVAEQAVGVAAAEVGFAAGIFVPRFILQDNVDTPAQHPTRENLLDTSAKETAQAVALGHAATQPVIELVVWNGLVDVLGVGPRLVDAELGLAHRVASD